MAQPAYRGDTRARVWGWGGGVQPARTPHPPPVRPVGLRRTCRRSLPWATSSPPIWACAAAVHRVRRSHAAAQRERRVSSRARAPGRSGAAHDLVCLPHEVRTVRGGVRRGGAPHRGRAGWQAIPIGIGCPKIRRAIAESPRCRRGPRPDAASCIQPRLARGADAGAPRDADGRSPLERGADAGALRGAAHAQGGAPLGAQRLAARGAPVAGEHASREASEVGGTFALPSLACALARYRHHHHQVPSSVLVGTNIQSCYHWIHIPAPAEEQPDTVAIVFTRVDDLHLWRSSEERCARPNEPVIIRRAGGAGGTRPWMRHWHDPEHLTGQVRVAEARVSPRHRRRVGPSRR